MAAIEESLLMQAEKAHYKFQMGMYFSSSHDTNGATIMLSERIEDAYWNYATEIHSNDIQLPHLLDEVEEFLSGRNRTPAIYITPWSQPGNLERTLELRGYEVMFKDAWMFYSKKTPPELETNPACQVKVIDSVHDMTAAVEVFNEAFGGASPEEPYGSLPPSYAQSLLSSFNSQGNSAATVNYIASIMGKPAGFGTLIHGNGFAGLYNIGVSPKYRRQGVGLAISVRRIQDALRAGSRVIFLQTEKDSVVESWQRKIGFDTEFVGEGFVLNKAKEE